MVEDNTISQVYHKGALWKGKAIVLDSAEIKIGRTLVKLYWSSFPNGLSVTWSNYFFNVWRGFIRDRHTMADWFQHPPQFK